MWSAYPLSFPEGFPDLLEHHPMRATEFYKAIPSSLAHPLKGEGTKGEGDVFSRKLFSFVFGDLVVSLTLLFWLPVVVMKVPGCRVFQV
jgi:hypothetical protein